MSRTDMTTQKVLWHLVLRGHLPPASAKGRVTVANDEYDWFKSKNDVVRGDEVYIRMEHRNASGKVLESVEESWKCTESSTQKQGGKVYDKAVFVRQEGIG